MNTIKSFVTLGALALVGCGSMYATSSEFATIASEKQTVCISADQSVVQQRISDHLRACYAGKGGTMIPAGGALVSMSGFHLLREPVDGATRFILRSDVYHLMMVDVVAQSSACGTTVDTYAASKYWKKSMAGVIAAANGNPPSECP